MAMNPPEVILSDKWFGNETKLVDLSPLEVARQLSLIDYKVFSTIQAKEFLNQAWSKEALRARSPNLRAMIKRSNDVSLHKKNAPKNCLKFLLFLFLFLSFYCYLCS